MESPERYYEILGVKPGATLEEIREAYKSLQKEFYPDYCVDDREKAVEKLREIYSAYKKLKVLHKNHPEDFSPEEQAGVWLDEGTADGKPALNEESTPVSPISVLKAELEKKAAGAASTEVVPPSSNNTGVDEAATEECAATFPSGEREEAKTGTGIPISADPAPVRFLKGIAFGGLVAAVCILAYAVHTPRQAADHPPSTPHAVTAGDKRTAAPAAALPVNKPARVADQGHVSPVKKPHERPNTWNARSRKDMTKATGKVMKIKYKARPSAAARPVASHKPPAINPKIEPKDGKYVAGSWKSETPGTPGADVAKDPGERQTQKKYKVDMYPFARY